MSVTELPEPTQPGDGHYPLILVRSDSDMRAIGAVIAKQLMTNPRVIVRAIGAGAVNQAIKGTTQARKKLAELGEDLILRPGFATVKGGNDNNADVSAIVLNCSLSVGGEVR